MEEYLKTIKKKSENLALAGHLVSMDDLVS